MATNVNYSIVGHNQMGMLELKFADLPDTVLIPTPLDSNQSLDFEAVQEIANDVYQDIVSRNEAAAEAFQEDGEECEDCARKRRNLLLAVTDYTQCIDSPLSEQQKLEAANIRQQLRDISTQVGFPTQINWPEIPFIPKQQYDEILHMKMCSCN